MLKKFLVGFVLVLICCTASFAQPGDPGGGGNPGDVPISGIEILLAAGALFGIRSLVTKKRDP